MHLPTAAHGDTAGTVLDIIGFGFWALIGVGILIRVVVVWRKKKYKGVRREVIGPLMQSAAPQSIAFGWRPAADSPPEVRFQDTTTSQDRDGRTSRRIDGATGYVDDPVVEVDLETFEVRLPDELAERHRTHGHQRMGPKSTLEDSGNQQEEEARTPGETGDPQRRERRRAR